MIITCSECSAQFTIDPNVLGDEGKTVRCSVCKHTWHQDPNAPDDFSDSSDADEKEPIEDIPEGVKPIPDDGKGEETIDSTDMAGKKGPIRLYKRNSIMASIAFFIVLGIVLFALGLFSGKDGATGEGLSFDKITIKSGDHNLTITGEIINLTPEKRSIPHIKAIVTNKDKATVAEWLIAPPEKTIDAESTLSFSAVYPEHVSHADQLKLSF